MHLVNIAVCLPEQQAELPKKPRSNRTGDKPHRSRLHSRFFPRSEDGILIPNFAMSVEMQIGSKKEF